MDYGLSQSTLGAARDRFAEKFFPGDATNPEFATAMSEIIERLHSEGYWVGAKATFSMAISDTGYITLPIHLDSILNARIDESPRLVHSERYNFLYSGPGEMDPTTNCSGLMIDKGVVSTEVEFPSTAGTIKVEATNATDHGKVVRVLGYDEDQALIRDGASPGEAFTLAGSPVTSTNTFKGIVGIQKPVTRGAVNIYHVGDEDTLLASVPGSVKYPIYRRYMVTAPESDNVIAYCKRRALPVVNEEDYLIPGNLSALKLAMYALNFEEKSDPERAQYYWGQCLKLLNDEASEHRGGAQEIADVSPWGRGVPGIRRLR